MTFSFFLTYADTATFNVPGVIKQDADTLRAAIELVASKHGWRIIDWDERSVWYEKDGKDFQYSVSEAQAV